MSNQRIRIGGASGFWGDSARATSQLLATRNLDFVVYDYLAEITMSIMARARASKPDMGYAHDFITAAMKPNLEKIADQGVKIVSNAGGVNPQSCAGVLRAIIREMQLDLKVACIYGDDLMSMRDLFADGTFEEMFSSEPFPNIDQVVSINAYLGAFPIAEALNRGADIVVTGRCVDSAVTLGACISAFGWSRDDLDQLAMGSLAGHILECGPQATGGNFTDWELVPDLDRIGYPIIEIHESGDFVCSKPDETGGLVSFGTVAEQMVYEIGDPQAYILPDVVCDFSDVILAETGDQRVFVSGAKGRPAPDSYKVCATYAQEFRGGTTVTLYGAEADRKARKLADAILKAARRTCKTFGLPEYTETSVEIIGLESQYGSNSVISGSREVGLKIAAKHPEAAGIGILLKETVGLGLATPPGLSGFQGGRPKPSPVVRLFSFLLPKGSLDISIDIEDSVTRFPDTRGNPLDINAITRPAPPSEISEDELIDVPLIKLAFGRSGDKGDKANIGIIARRPEYLPYIYSALSQAEVGKRFDHFLPAQAHTDYSSYVERFLMPGSNAINFLIHDVLGGGGVASIRNDPQGKGYAQILLDVDIPVSHDIAKQIHGA